MIAFDNLPLPLQEVALTCRFACWRAAAPVGFGAVELQAS
jgi:hypothetical protein